MQWMQSPYHEGDSKRLKEVLALDDSEAGQTMTPRALPRRTLRNACSRRSTIHDPTNHLLGERNQNASSANQQRRGKHHQIQILRPSNTAARAASPSARAHKPLPQARRRRTAASANGFKFKGTRTPVRNLNHAGCSGGGTCFQPRQALQANNDRTPRAFRLARLSGLEAHTECRTPQQEPGPDSILAG